LPIAVTILYGFAPLRALGQNWLQLFTAFCRCLLRSAGVYCVLPALAIMIFAEQCGRGDRMDRVRSPGFKIVTVRSAAPRSRTPHPHRPHRPRVGGGDRPRRYVAGQQLDGGTTTGPRLKR